MSTLSSSSAAGESAEMTPILPNVQMEYRLLALFLTSLLGQPLAPSASPLSIQIRPSLQDTSRPDALLPMNVLKSSLGEFAKQRGWAEDLGTKAIYGLVAKRVLRIDRREREAQVCFTA